MRFDIITLFPKIIHAYLGESILKRAREKKLVEFCVHDLRHYAKDKHHKVDDRPFGGGPGMVLKIEPLMRALDAIMKKTKKQSRRPPGSGLRPGASETIVLFSAGGKQFDSKKAQDWAKKYNRIVMIAGRYEGVDGRIKKLYKMEEISIGPYVLTGGELPTLIVADAVSRHIPGVLGKNESLEEKRHGIGVPVYSRPAIFVWPASGRGKKTKTYRVPKELLSGAHKKIMEWRKKHVK